MKRKKRDEGLKDVLFSLAKGLSDFSYRSLGVKRYWYWEYYESIKDDIKDAKLRRRMYQQIYHMEKFGYFEKDGFAKKALDKLKAFGESGKDRIENWDGSWRIVIFDIPEKKRKLRDGFRFALREFGFKMLQGSIWICPYGDFEEVRSLIKDQGIQKYVVFIISDQISNDLLYKRKFGID